MDINWSLVSAAFCTVSGLYYTYLAWRGEIHPNPVSWLIWMSSGVGMCVTAYSAEATAVFWTSVVNAATPTLVFLIVLFKLKAKVAGVDSKEKLCLFLAVCGYIVWIQYKDVPELAQYALYWMIIVDGIGLSSTIRQVYRDPTSDKPIAWVIFGFGFALATLEITDHTLANWAMPIYSVIGAIIVSIPLIWHRLKTQIPVREWV